MIQVINISGGFIGKIIRKRLMMLLSLREKESPMLSHVAALKMARNIVKMLISVNLLLMVLFGI